MPLALLVLIGSHKMYGQQFSNHFYTHQVPVISGYVKGNGHFRLAIDNPKRERLHILVVDASGKVFYEDKSRAMNVRKSLDICSTYSERLYIKVKSEGVKTVVYAVDRIETRFALASLKDS